MFISICPSHSFFVSESLSVLELSFSYRESIVPDLDWRDLGRLSNRRSDRSSLARLLDIEVVLDRFVSNSALSK